MHRVPYLALAKTFERIEEETKRLKIISILTNFFRSVFLISPDEVVPCVYLCLNKVGCEACVYRVCMYLVVSCKVCTDSVCLNKEVHDFKVTIISID